jgi:hypothetical protein
MNKVCRICKHPLKNHKKFITTDQKGNPYPAKIRCNCVATECRVGVILCGCDGKKLKTFW